MLDQQLQEQRRHRQQQALEKIEYERKLLERMKQKEDLEQQKQRELKNKMYQ